MIIKDVPMQPLKTIKYKRMKVVILAGGYGTRISEESEIRPKPMVEIGGKPILWHIMKIYSAFGYNEFVILLGYKGFQIKEYFANYFLHHSDVTFDLKENRMSTHNNSGENWKVTLIDTGIDTMTGGRIRRAKDFLNDETFMLTYGDGVADINISELVDFHKKNKNIITMSTVQPEGRYGIIEFGDKNFVTKFLEKPKGDTWINGGFFVCEPQIFEYLENDETIFEREPLEKLSSENKLSAFKHNGFWKCMDTLRDKIQLNELWNSGNAKWKVW
jgi:glucose-1-phosphate cytidylyltransferase